MLVEIALKAVLCAVALAVLSVAVGVLVYLVGEVSWAVKKRRRRP